ncbi:hypothetical protein BJF78_20165 [Pseudonocardia sp. CNS-139]|nr:hypothetical protein BJF78_20165 [Pseudonocardia sp. CNS-139]
MIAGLATLLVMRLQRRPEPVRRPTVEDLVRAVRDVREAEADVRRAEARADTEPVLLSHPPTSGT